MLTEINSRTLGIDCNLLAEGSVMYRSEASPPVISTCILKQSADSAKSCREFQILVSKKCASLHETHAITSYMYSATPYPAFAVTHLVYMYIYHLHYVYSKAAYIINWPRRSYTFMDAWLSLQFQFTCTYMYYMCNWVICSQLSWPHSKQFFIM